MTDLPIGNYGFHVDEDGHIVRDAPDTPMRWAWERPTEIGRLVDAVLLEAQHGRALELDAMPPAVREWAIWLDCEIERVQRELLLYGTAGPVGRFPP